MLVCIVDRVGGEGELLRMLRLCLLFVSSFLLVNTYIIEKNVNVLSVIKIMC